MSNAEEDEIDVESICGALRNPGPICTRQDFLAQECLVPKSPGIYAWYFQYLPKDFPVSGCYRWQWKGKDYFLLYIGVSPSRSGSAANLRKRIGNHLKGDASRSTLRKTIGHILGFKLLPTESGKRLTFGIREKDLSEWIDNHAAVTWCVVAEPWLQEADVIKELKPLLNLDHNRDHPDHERLKKLRAPRMREATQSPNASIDGWEAQLRQARKAIYHTNGNMSEQAALSVITQLSNEGYPAAMLELGHLYWAAYAVVQNNEKAFDLVSKAVEMDFVPATASLGGLYFSGIGCEKNLEKALYWYEQANIREHGFYYVHFGAVALDRFEFQRELCVAINGIKRSLPIAFIEHLNRWRLACKRKVIANQSAILDRNSNAFAGTHKRCLPFKGAIGGTCIKFSGEQSIEQIGWQGPFLDDEIWFSLTELGFNSSELPLFSELFSLCIENNGFWWSIEEETCQMIREFSQHLPESGDERVQIEQKGHPNVLELSAVFTSVGEMGSFGFRGGKELLTFDYT